MNSKKIAAVFCLAAALTAIASPVLAARGGRGGGRVGGSPSITRTAPARPSQQTDRSAGRQSSQPIDQGIDPKDYGRRNAGKENTTAGTAGNTAGQTQNPAVQNRFTGGGIGGFFNGFSLWPWLWFSGHNSAAASDGDEGNEPELESFSEMLGRWWDNVLEFFRSLFSF